MKNEIVTLITKSVNGSVVTDVSKDVFAEKKSVNRSEFYAGVGSGLTPKLIFLVDVWDYEDANEPSVLEYKGKKYDIIRIYETDSNIEITVGERP